MASRLAILLKLNIDPDDLPDGVMKSQCWVDKETRRRAWWCCYILDRTISTFYNQQCCLPIVAGPSKVKPLCKEELWTSLREPGPSDSDADRAAAAATNVEAADDDNICTYLVRLCDLYIEIGDAARRNSTYLRLCRSDSRLGTVSEAADSDGNSNSNSNSNSNEGAAAAAEGLARERERVASEDAIRRRMDAAYAAAPAHFRPAVDDTDWVLEAVADPDSSRFQTLLLFANYHGWRCFLLRRQLIMYLRCVAAEAAAAGELGGNSGGDGSGGGGPAVPPLVEAPAAALAVDGLPERERLAVFWAEYRAAFGSALESAAAMAGLCRCLARCNASLPQLPSAFLYAAGHAALALLLVHAAGVAIAPLPPLADEVGAESSTTTTTNATTTGAAAVCAARFRDTPRLVAAGFPSAAELAGWVAAARHVVAALCAAHMLDGLAGPFFDLLAAADHAGRARRRP
ncbi:hypothetical protein HK405_015923, partial [Cladochytrium tenue]